MKNQDLMAERVWDESVPIVRDDKYYHAYITDQIGSPWHYNELCYLLDKATHEDTFILHLNTPGGVIDSAFQIIHSLNHTSANTISSITGSVASAGTVVALSCKELEIADHSTFMIHNYSGGAQGKGNEIKEYMKFAGPKLKADFKYLYSGFLSDEEIEDVSEDKDFWFDADETRRRWDICKSMRVVNNVQNTRHKYPAA